RRSIEMNLLRLKAAVAASALLMAAPLLFAQNEGQTQGQAVITVLPAKNAETAPALSQQDVQVKINGKEATVTNWTPYRGDNGRLEVVVMLDAGARTSMANQF